jgi:hypothetical protein
LTLQFVIIRADASLVLGTGHVVRCLTLARALRERAVTVRFVCREQKGHLCELIAASGFAVDRLPAVGSDVQDNTQSWQEDARLTRDCIAGLRMRADWLVVDHYSLERCAGESARHGLYVCTEHTPEVVDAYFNALDPIFALIKQCEEGRDVKTLLKGPVCHGGFKRLN